MGLKLTTILAFQRNLERVAYIPLHENKSTKTWVVEKPSNSRIEYLSRDPRYFSRELFKHLIV